MTKAAPSSAPPQRKPAAHPDSANACCAPLPSQRPAADAALDAWWRELDRAECVLGRVGPDDICCAGLTPRQTMILKTLVEREGARLSDLAEAVRLSASALTRVLEKLERQGLVERVRGTQADGRAATVRITARGRHVRQEIDELMRTRCCAIVDAIPEAKRQSVLEALRVFNTALETVDCGCRAAHGGPRL